MESGAITEAYQSAREDLAQGGVSTKLLLGAMAVGLVFEWGTGNEALLGLVGAHAYNATHNSLATGAITGSTSFVEQSLLGVGMALNIDRFPTTMGRLQDRMSREHNTDRQQPSLGNKALSAFALGTAVSLLKDRSGEKRPLRQNLQEAIGLSALIGAGVTLVASGSAAITNYGAEHGLEHQAHILVDILSSPFTYLGIFGTKLVYDKAKQFFKRHRDKPVETPDS
ncbi:MAG TPA: hypothetical protein VK712_00935 [Verrucomicrobiae bacterium]|jgi:hypothetical protein|nr:hypothetical protein [Verrucomicrobiae bacterium]